MSVIKLPARRVERKSAEILAMLEPIDDSKLLKFARIALDIAQDRAESGEENPEIAEHFVLATAALGLIFERAR